MKPFKRISFMVLVLAVFSFWMAGPANAALIGLTPSYPDLFSNSQGTYSYDASTQLFTITALPEKLAYSGTPGDKDFIIESSDSSYSGQISYTAVIMVDNSGNFISGGTGAQNTLTIIGKVLNQTYDGLLLTADITDFGWGALQGSQQLFDFTFDITGGELAAGLFGEENGGAIVTSEISGFNNSWAEDFSGTFVKIDTFVPIPAAAWLFGSGLICLVGIRRKLR